MELYNIQGWGRKYFSINTKGNVAVTPREGYASVDLREVMDELQVRDITSPVLLRFPDILDNRIEKISNCRFTTVQLRRSELYNLPYQGQSDAACGGGDCDLWGEIQYRTGSRLKA